MIQTSRHCDIQTFRRSLLAWFEWGALKAAWARVGWVGKRESGVSPTPETKNLYIDFP